MKHYTVELRIREAGDVGDALPVKATVEVPRKDYAAHAERKSHRTVGLAVEWALEKAWEWMRNRETGQ